MAVKLKMLLPAIRVPSSRHVVVADKTPTKATTTIATKPVSRTPSCERIEYHTIESWGLEESMAFFWNSNGGKLENVACFAFHERLFANALNTIRLRKMRCGGKYGIFFNSNGGKLEKVAASQHLCRPAKNSCWSRQKPQQLSPLATNTFLQTRFL
jgi:hypothetical protein